MPAVVDKPVEDVKTLKSGGQNSNQGVTLGTGRVSGDISLGRKKLTVVAILTIVCLAAQTWSSVSISSPKEWELLFKPADMGRLILFGDFLPCSARKAKILADACFPVCSKAY